jgi:hypothetical protein
MPRETVPPVDLPELRLYVHRELADQSRTVTTADVAQHFDVPEGAALAGLRALHDAHLIVLDGARERVAMAHPWAAAPMGFVVASSTQKWWGGCAWDSFAIPALVGEKCLVATHCPGCGTPLALDVAPDSPPSSDPAQAEMVAHFLVPVRRIWDDVVFTCSHQLLFCSRGHVDAWLARTGNDLGAVLDLTSLWWLATGWYAGRLTPGYRRRTPTEAAQFFAGIGLVGDFWRTD